MVVVVVVVVVGGGGEDRYSDLIHISVHRIDLPPCPLPMLELILLPPTPPPDYKLIILCFVKLKWHHVTRQVSK